MKLSAKFRQLGTTMLVIVTLLSAAACDDSFVYDGEGDCSVTYRLHFRYDMNMAFADAFAHEVNSINLYAFNQDGVLVWQKSEKGEILKADDYAMTLELPTGSYDLVAWCGLDNDGTRTESFAVPQMQVGVSKKDELTCALNRKHAADGSAYTDEDLYRLFHGSLSVDILDHTSLESVPGVHDLYMNLTKNTNRFSIVLQQLSGEDVNPDDFIFEIEEENGLMNFDNSLLPDENITYRQFRTRSGSAGVEEYIPLTRAITEVNVAIADITVGRMMAGRKMMLTVTRKADNQMVIRVPLIDYVLLAKDNEETPYPLSDQEYLDREDSFTCTFFLDSTLAWYSSVIYINSWRVVINETDLN